MKNLSLYFLLLIASPAFAIGDFSGHWVADHGEVKSNIGVQGSCRHIEIVITQTSDALTTESYKADCDLYGTTWGPVREDLKGGKVFEAGQEVGTIDDSTLQTRASDGSVIYLYNLKLVPSANGGLELDSEYGTQNGFGTILTTARLHKQ